MKAFFNTGVIIVILSLLAVGCSHSENENARNGAEVIAIAPENLVVVDYAVSGMVCAMGCAKTIQDEIAEMGGVAICEVNFEDEKAHIEFDKTQLSEKEIIAKIESIAEGQYKVTAWESEELIEEETSNEYEESDAEKEEPLLEVTLPVFEMPNLFTYLLERI